MNNTPSSRRATPRPGGAPQSDALRATLAPAGRQSFRRLQVSWWFTPLLTAATLLCAAALVAVAYLGAQSNALAAAQARNGQGALAANLTLTSDGAGLSVDANGDLVASGNGVSVIPAHDSATANRLQALVGEGVAIYQLHNGGLTVISTSPDVVSAQGAVLSGAASAELIGQCGAKSTTDCRQQYLGETVARGVAYVAGFAPLFDTSGVFVGVVGVLTPLAVVMQPTMQLLVTLSLVGLLVTLAALAAGLWVFGVLGGRRLDEVSARLGALGVVAANAEETVYAHAVRARRQERLGRQLAEEAYQLDALANALTLGHAALQDEVNDVWAGASQPGIAPNGSDMLRMARQTAVAAARIGADAEDAASLSRQMGPLMNTLIAEDHALVESAQTTERLAGDLRAALDQVEMALGASLAPRPQKALSGLRERARQVSQRLKRQPDSTGPARPARASATPQRATPPLGGAPRMGDTGVHGVRRSAPGLPGNAGGARPQTGQHPAAPRPQTGQHPAAPRRPTGAGRMPAPQTPNSPSSPPTPPQRPSGAQRSPWSGGLDAGSAKGASSSGWRTPSNEHPAAPWSASGEYQSPWLDDLPNHPSNPNVSGRRYPAPPNTPSHPGRDPKANDTGWLND